MARSTVQGAPLSSEELREIDEYWRASLYLCLGMLYLQDNPLLREPLKIEHIKPRMLGHWGSDAGQCFTYIHFNRLINKYDLNAIYVSGPGHGAPAVLSQGYLEGTYSEVYPDKTEDVKGMQRFFKQFWQRAAVAGESFFAQHHGQRPGLAPGPQWVHAPGSRLPRRGSE
jgi:xylulose-5-phosphate/fructose-6-phosphate phosphoketolase